MMQPAPSRHMGRASAPSAEAVRLAGLGNRFVELFARKLSRQDLATEIASLIAAATRAKAAVILGLDPRRDHLVLLGDSGLSNEARAALGGGGDCQWDIPLRGLRNRRISVITAAHQNPFVPRGLVSLSPNGLSIASLPIYDERDPTGVLLLFSTGGRSFPDAQLQVLSQSLRVCARALRDHESVAPRADVAARDTANIAAAIAELAGEVPGSAGGDGADVGAVAAAGSAQPGPPPDERIQRLEEQIAHVREELERTATKLRASTIASNALTRERDHFSQRIAELEGERETAGSELRAEMEALQERLLAVESERARYQRLADDRHTRAQQTIKSLASERDSVLERVQQAESKVTVLDGALAAVKNERTRLSAQVDNLTGQLRAAQEAHERADVRHTEERTAIEADREGWKEQAAGLRTQLRQRTDELGTLDRELRSTTVAREGALAQVQAARAEIERLTALNDDSAQALGRAEAARVRDATDIKSLHRILENDRAEQAEVEQNLRGELGTLNVEADRLRSELTALRTELDTRAQMLATRDEEIARTRAEQQRAQHAEASWLQADSAHRAEITTLTARLEQLTAAHQQALDERAALHTAVADGRRQTAELEVAHATAVADLESQATQLHRQVETLTAERVAVAGRLERALEEGQGLARTLAEAQRRAEDLGELARRREAAAEATAGEREQLAAQVAALTAQLQVADEARQRAQTRDTQERTALETDRNEWKVQASTSRKELARATDRLITLEGELRATVVARDAAAAELQTANAEAARVAAVAEERAQRLTQLEADHAAVRDENANFRTTLDDERTARGQVEQASQRSLTAARAEAERSATEAAALRAELSEYVAAVGDRDQQITTLRNDLEVLRQHSADRGVLARQVNDLGVTIGELEQQLDAARKDEAHAQRKHAALGEKLEAVRRRETELKATAAREQAALHETIQSLTGDRDRLQAAHDAQLRQAESQQRGLADLQSALDNTRGEHRQTHDVLRETAGRLAAAEQQLETLHTVLRQREEEVATEGGMRQQLETQLDAVRAEEVTLRQALESATASAAEERHAFESERAGLQEQLRAAQNETQRLAGALKSLETTATDLDTARGAVLAERAALAAALDAERAAAQELRAERDGLHAAGENLAAEAAGLQTALAERDAQLAAAAEREDHRQQEATALQHTITRLRGDAETLAAQVAERTAQLDQARDGHAALERQMALVVATHGEEEQALASGMQAAREQIAQLEGDRAALQATLTEARQQLTGSQSANAARLAEAQAEVAELRTQLQTTTGKRSELTKQLERAEKATKTQSERADKERRRAETLDGQQQLLQKQLAIGRDEHAALETTLAQLRGELGRLTTQVDAGVAERDRAHAEHAALERQLAQLTTASGDHERALSQQLDAARAAGAQLEQERTTLQSALAAAEVQLREARTTHTAAQAEAQRDGAALREQMTALRTARDTLSEQLAAAEQGAARHSARAEVEGQRATTLAGQNDQLQQHLAAAEQRHTTLETDLAQARAEIEALQQQSEDRGILAHEAGELKARIGALEQQIAAARGEAAEAGRQHAAVAQELDAARRQHAETETTAGREQAKLQAMLERLGDERRQFENEAAARAAEVVEQRATLAELQAAAARAGEAGQATAQRLAETQRRAEELTAQLHQRDAAAETAAAERQRLTAQIATLTAQVRATQETLDAVNGRWALERTTLESERESFKETQAADRAELQRLVAQHEELTLQAAQLESNRTVAAAEAAALRRTVEEVRAAQQQGDESLRAELAERQAETQRVSSELAAARGEVAERDELLALAFQEQEVGRRAAEEHQQTISTLRGQLAASAAQLQQSADECETLRAAREKVDRQIALLEAARGEEGQRLTQGLQTASAQIAQLEQERADARAALADARERLTQAEAAHAAMQTRLDGSVAELRQEVTMLTDARAVLAQRAEHLERTAREQAEQVDAESRRAAAAAARCTELEQSLAAAESQRTTLDAAVQRHAAEIAALRHDSADRGALARQVGDANNTIGALEVQLAELQRHVAQAEQRRTALVDELEAANQEQARARAAAAEQEALLQASVQQLTDERAALVAERTAQQHQLEAQGITLSELHATLEQAQTERQRVEEDGRDTAQRLGEVHRRLDELSERVRQRDAAAEAATAERQRLEDALRAADTRIAELSSECESWQQRAEAAGSAAGDDEALGDADDFVVRMERDSGPPTDAPLVIERSAPLDALLDGDAEAVEPLAVEPEPEPEPEAAEVIRIAQEMVLLDASGRGDEAFQVLKGAGFEVTRNQANDAAVDDLATRKVSCVMLNLAAGPAAWRTLKMLRERAGTRNIPLLAYLMAPDSQRGFCFGRADFGIWPMDGERLTERLTSLRPKLKRLLAVSADIDGMGRVRDPLTRAGISISSVLDGKQALEFASMVQPEAALFHLSPSCGGVARAITALRAGESTRDMPMVVLLDKTSPREEAFFAITARELIGKGMFTFANLPAELARLLA